MPRVMRAAVSPGLCAPGPAGPEREHVRDRRLAQLLLGPRGGAHGGHLGEPRDQRPAREHRGDDDDRVADVRPVRPVAP